MGQKVPQFILCIGTFQFHRVHGDRECINAPERKEEGEWDVKDVMLDLAQGRVMFWIRRPCEEEGIGGKVLINSHFICQSVVLVVFVTPPSWSQPRRDGGERSHEVSKFVNTVNVIVA